MAGGGHYAILSGACASAASMFGKLSGLPSLEGLFLLRVTFFLLMILCNGGVWTLYVKALQASTSSLSATVSSAATNYLFSAFTGFVLFGELTSLLWWAGTGLILMGLILILTDQEIKDQLLAEAKEATETQKDL